MISGMKFLVLFGFVGTSALRINQAPSPPPGGPRMENFKSQLAMAPGAGLPPPPSISDDPHVTNMLGQRMDVYGGGWLPVVVVPPGTGSSNLRVEGLIENVPLGLDKTHACPEAYVTQARITGAWFPQNITVQQPERKLSVMVGHTELLSPGTCSSEICELYHDQTGLTISRNGQNVNIVLPSPDSPDGKFSQGLMHFNLKSMHEKYFNLHVSGLETFTSWGVGGILGDSGEDFTTWTIRPKQCDLPYGQNLVGGKAIVRGSMIVATSNAQ